MNLYFLEIDCGITNDKSVRHYEKLTAFNAKNIIRSKIIISSDLDFKIKWSYLDSTGYVTLNTTTYIINIDFANKFSEKKRNDIINYTSFGELFKCLNQHIREDKIDNIIK